jgi:FdhD protein
MRASRAGEETRKIGITRISRGTRRGLSDLVVRESPVTIFLNDVELATFMCSPRDLEQLAVGFLYTENVISGGDDINDVIADEREGVVWVKTRDRRRSGRDLLSRRLVTAGCGRGLSFNDISSGGKTLRVRSAVKVSPGELMALMREFQRRSDLYRRTGGVHSAALCEPSGVLVLKEDIGRHNAVDKVVGECVMNRLDMSDRILATSGRISSEMLIKAARANIPIVLSKSAPTDLGVSLAKDFGITLVGFVRGSRMNVYSNVGRISKGERQSVSTERK